MYKSINNSTFVQSHLVHIFLSIYLILCDICVPKFCIVLTKQTNFLKSTSHNSMLQSSPLLFNVNENTPIGTIIGQLTELIYPHPRFDMKYSLPRNAYFEIDPTSALRIIGELDRDENVNLCIEPNYPAQCVWTSFAINTDNQYIGIRITINDMNDNIPKWPQSFIKINVPEEINNVQKFELPIAKDPDYGLNSIQNYHLKTDTADTNLFKLIVEKTKITNLSLYNFHLILSVLTPLDRERQSWYNVSLLCMDGGKPYHTSTLKITIQVIDENDHNPKFSSPQYEAFISEDLEIGNIIYLTETNTSKAYSDSAGQIDHQLIQTVKQHQLHATDMDEGYNGEIEYNFAASTISSVLEYFDLDKQTGLLYVRKSLNYDTGPSEWQFQILASDKGRPSRTSSTMVKIKLRDANTHPPTIQARFIPHTRYQDRIRKLNITVSDSVENHLIHIPENVEPSKDPLVIFTTNDQDTGTGGQFNCELDPIDRSDKPILLYDASIMNQFRLDLTGNLPKWKVYSLFALTVLDREQQGPKITLNIVCVDNGSPQLSSTYTLTILIIDENDDVPTFTEPHYKIRVVEGNQPNTTIAQIVAVDRDDANNGQVSYEISWPSDFESKHNGDIFKITEEGKLIATRSLDREQIPDGYRFTVIARDHGFVQLSSSITVQIILDDVNDCVPKFKQSEYNFTIKEDFMKNISGPRLVGIIKAEDCDLGVNALLSYSILDQGMPFKVDNQGLLKTNGLIDRETRSIYQFNVLVTDGIITDTYPSQGLYRHYETGAILLNEQRIHTAAVSVRIIITDLNDNSPVFVYPNTSVLRIRLYKYERKGFILTRLIAVDQDYGFNKKIRYKLLKGDPNHIFGVRHDTGELIVTNEIKQEINDTISLTIEATDHGQPPLASRITVEILVTDSPAPLGQGLGLLDEIQLANLRSLGRIGISELDGTFGAVQLNKLIMISIVVTTAVICVVLVIVICLFVRRTTCPKLFQSDHCSVQQNEDKLKSLQTVTISKTNSNIKENEATNMMNETKQLKDQNQMELCDVLSHIQHRNQVNQLNMAERKSSLIRKTANSLSTLLRCDEFNTVKNMHYETHELMETSQNSGEQIPVNSGINNIESLFTGHMECNKLVTDTNHDLLNESSYRYSPISSAATIYGTPQSALLNLPRVCAIHGCPSTTMKLVAVPINESDNHRLFSCANQHNNLCIPSISETYVLDSDCDSGRGGSVSNNHTDSGQMNTTQTMTSSSAENKLMEQSTSSIVPLHYIGGNINLSLIPVTMATSLQMTSSTCTSPTILIPQKVTDPTLVLEQQTATMKRKLTGERLHVTFAEYPPTETENTNSDKIVQEKSNTVSHYSTQSNNVKDKGPWRLIQCGVEENQFI